MIGLLCFVVAVLASAFKSKIRLEAEKATLRHQLVVLRRKVKGRAHLTNNDRWFLVQMYRWFPLILEVVTIVRPETLVHWHRVGFRRFWGWKSNSRGGRPRIEIELRALIRQMSTENQLWGAPRIHGELLKLGFSVAQSTVAKYMVKRRGPPSQGWRTFLRTHAPDIAAMDLFVVPPGKVCPLDDVSRISTIHRALRLRYDGECLSDRLGRNLKLTVNPRYKIGRVHDHEFSSVWSGANDTIEFARFAIGRLDARRSVCLRILSGEILQIVGDQDAGVRGVGGRKNAAILEIFQCRVRRPA